MSENKSSPAPVQDPRPGQLLDTDPSSGEKQVSVPGLIEPGSVAEGPRIQLEAGLHIQDCNKCGLL